MNDDDIVAILRLVPVSVMLIFVIFSTMRDRRERRRVEALFLANAAKYGRRRDDA